MQLFLFRKNATNWFRFDCAKLLPDINCVSGIVPTLFSLDWNRGGELCDSIECVSHALAFVIRISIFLCLISALSSLTYDSIVPLGNCSSHFPIIRNESTSNWIMAMTRLRNLTQCKVGVACSAMTLEPFTIHINIAHIHKK